METFAGGEKYSLSGFRGKELNDEFMEFSVQPGNNYELQMFDYPSANVYIAAAKCNIPIHNWGLCPKSLSPPMTAYSWTSFAVGSQLGLL